MGPKNILFVDDERKLLKGLERVFRKYTDEFTVYFAGSAEEALEYFKTKKFDAVVADYKMPGMDGLALLNLIKEQYPHVKRIMLTGQSDEEFLERDKDTVHEFLSKPCENEILISLLKNIL